MAVFRIERTRDYTVMSNHHLRNHELSLKAKGQLWIAEHQSEIANLERRVKFMADKPTNRERLQEITAGIEQGIKELFESEKYMRYLSVMSKFHRYSVNNTMLIYRCRVRPEPTLTSAITVSPHDTLGCRCKPLFLLLPRWVEIINAGQHILQCECVVEDTVGSVPERQRQLRSCEPSKEGQEQSCQCAFAGTGFTNQEQHKFWFAPGQLQEVIQRSEESKCQKGQDYLLRRGHHPKYTGHSLNVQNRALPLHPVALHFSGQVYGDGIIPGHEKVPLPIDLLPTSHGVNSPAVSILGCGLDCIANAVLYILPYFQNAMDTPVPCHPVEIPQFVSGNFDFWKWLPALVNPSQTNSAGGFHTVVQRNLADDPWHEIAQLAVIGSLLAVPHFHKAVVYGFVVGRIGWCFNVLFCIGHS